MKRVFREFGFFAFVVACLAILLMGCHVDGDKKYSDDVAAFRDLIDLDLSIKSIRWEVFGTPEYSGGVPGPTDFVTLIAEISPPASVAKVDSTNSEAVWIVPEAVRPWLSPAFRTLFAKYRNTSVSLRALADCRALKGKLRKTGRMVEGIVCSNAQGSVIYMTIADFTAP